MSTGVCELKGNPLTPTFYKAKFKKNGQKLIFYEKMLFLEIRFKLFK